MLRAREDKLLPVSRNDFDSSSLNAGSKQAPRILGMDPVLASAITYCTMSASMVLLNKYALSSFHFTCTNSLLFAQCATSVLLVKASERMGFCKLEPLRTDIVSVRVRHDKSTKAIDARIFLYVNTVSKL